ncbi:MAG TPA: energy transducer TonB [Pyrinomonadaceae bacterium]|jgi:protein TonB|nr:energy transducer TonB [Pyrinomonadaceae bacterium]
MFEKLVESGSHSQDLTRKGSFFLGTLGIYAILLLFAGLGSIYAYDAHLERQDLEFGFLLAPPVLNEQPSPQPERPRDDTPRDEADNSRTDVAVRTEAFAPPNDPSRVNNHVSTMPGNTPPIPRNGVFVIGPVNSAPSGGDSNRATSGSANGLVEVGNPPPPAAPRPQPTPVPATPKIVSLGVIEGKAVSKPMPAYPPIARTARVSGPVVVQIIVDTDGKVIEAKALSGHALLQQAAVRAAYQARFTPTLLSKQPVKVSGMITYNFVLQ